MGVFRVNKNSNYTVMANYHFKEKGMSLKAKGLLSLMLSLPEEWDFSAAGLTQLSKDGKDSVNAALKELEKFNYLNRTQTYDDKGRFSGYDYEIFEKPTTENSIAEKPLTEKPTTENPQQLNTNKLNTKKSNTKELNNNNTRFSKPTLEEVKKYCLERNNNVDPQRFIDYYEANGWKVGRNKMKDWKAAVRTWERNDKPTTNKTTFDVSSKIRTTEFQEFKREELNF